MTPTISVIVPVYNVERYLPRCIDSILSQTFTDFQLILIDDGSPDACGRICDEYAARDPRIGVIHQDNGGVSSARNRGLDVAQGEYVCFVDPDDIIFPCYLETLIATAQSSGSDLIVCGYQNSYVEDDVLINSRNMNKATPGNYQDFSDILTELHKNTLLFMPVNKLYKNSIIKTACLSFPKQKRYEDTAFVYRYLRHCRSLSFCDAILYNYYHYMSGRKTATTSFIPRLYDAYALVYQEGLALCEIMEQNGMRSVDDFRKEIEKHLFCSLGGDLVVNLARSDLTYKERTQYIRSALKDLPSTAKVPFEGRTDQLIYFLIRKKAVHLLVWMGYLKAFKK